MAMLRARASAGSTAPFRLLYSVREPGAVFYRDELVTIADRDRAVRIDYTYTRAVPKDWPRPPGRIDAASIASAIWPSNLVATFYVCGPTSFVETAAGLISANGNTPDKIKTERFGPTGDRK
jgi:ferredoxin-NADP reductase